MRAPERPMLFPRMTLRSRLFPSGNGARRMVERLNSESARRRGTFAQHSDENARQNGELHDAWRGIHEEEGVSQAVMKRTVGTASIPFRTK
jgi:hypothetical protein